MQIIWLGHSPLQANSPQQPCVPETAARPKPSAADITHDATQRSLTHVLTDSLTRQQALPSSCLAVVLPASTQPACSLPCRRCLLLLLCCLGLGRLIHQVH